MREREEKESKKERRKKSKLLSYLCSSLSNRLENVIYIFGLYHSLLFRIIIFINLLSSIVELVLFTLQRSLSSF